MTNERVYRDVIFVSLSVYVFTIYVNFLCCICDNTNVCRCDHARYISFCIIIIYIIIF